MPLTIALVFLITFLHQPWLGAGWFWDTGNALGFLALAGVLFQMIPAVRSKAARRHERLGYWVLGTALIHAGWFLVGDGAVRFYLQPGAPFAMWAGLAALIGLALLTVLARMPDRMRVHKRFRSFLRTHRLLGYAVVGAAVLHIGLTGFYLSTWLQAALLILLASAACLGRPLWSRLTTPPVASSRAYLIAGALACAVFVVIRDLGS